MPRCPEFIQSIDLSWSFWLWGRARSCRVPGAENQVHKDRICFTNLPFHWIVLSSSIHYICVYFACLFKTLWKEDFQNYFRNWREWSEKCAGIEEENFKGNSYQCVFYCSQFFKKFKHSPYIVVTASIGDSSDTLYLRMPFLAQGETFIPNRAVPPSGPAPTEPCALSHRRARCGPQLTAPSVPVWTARRSVTGSSACPSAAARRYVWTAVYPLFTLAWETSCVSRSPATFWTQKPHLAKPSNQGSLVPSKASSFCPISLT